MSQLNRNPFALAAGLAIASLLLAACGDSESASPAPSTAASSPTTTAPPDAVTTTAPASPEASSITACELLPADEAEAIVGAPLVLIEASDDFRCSYDGGLVDGELVGALLSILPTPSDVDDLLSVRDALDPATVEDIDGLGEAAYYWDAGAVHSLNFVKNGVLVTVTVTEVVDGDDVRTAEMQIATAAAARL